MDSIKRRVSSKAILMKGQVLKPMLSIIIAIVGMVSILIGLGIFLFVQFVLGGAYAEVAGIDDKAYHVSEVLATYPFQNKKILEPVLQAAIIKRLDDKTASEMSTTLNDFLGQYDFSYEISLPLSEPEQPKCVTPYSDKHKAVDISAGCGTPVKAVCGGRLETIKFGFSSDPVLIGTIRGESQGLKIDHDKNCEWPDRISLYGCIGITDKKSGPVKKGDIIGYVSTCNAEKEAGCHLHFGIMKSITKREEDPTLICNSNSISSVLGKQVNLLAKKGDFEKDVQEFSIPLLFKDKIERLVVKIG